MIVSMRLQEWLNRLPVWAVSIFAAICAFSVYFCMYAFRKPFTSAGFNEMQFLHIDYKVWLVTAQVIGYMLSKFYGIHFISGMKSDRRAQTIVLLIGIAWIALLFFAFIPAPYNIIFLLINGFPLGMVWGLVFSFLEGRKTTEFLGAVLSTSFIFSSGVVKSIGKYIVLNWHVSEIWMPFVTGALFFLPTILFTSMLNHVPPPSADDIALRCVRLPMTSQERKNFLNLFLPGIVLVVFTYVLLTILRDFRDNFANELWNELGFGNQSAIFMQAEIPISIVVLISMSLLILVKNNFKAFMINHYIVFIGYFIALISTLLFSHHILSPVVWMVMVGAGLYLSYVPFNCLYFERMIATYRIKGNVGFIMYIADSFGYLGSVIVLFIKQFLGIQLSWVHFFINSVFAISLFGIAGTLLAMIYFKRNYYSTLTMQTSYAI